MYILHKKEQYLNLKRKLFSFSLLSIYVANVFFLIISWYLLNGYLNVKIYLLIKNKNNFF